MCGIIASLTKEPSLDNMLRVKFQYKEQDHRGQNGFGFVAIQDHKVIYARATNEKEILEELDKLGETTLIMFHHRIPTCNMNAVKTNHPIFVASKKNLDHKYFIIHNGMIQNTVNLRKEHEAEGFKYRTDLSWKYSQVAHIYNDHTDTESLGIEMAKFIDGETSRIKARGNVACFILQMDYENHPIAFYFFRESNPVNWYRNQKGMFMASEAKGQELPKDRLFRLDLKDWTLSSKSAHLSKWDEVGTKDVIPQEEWELVTKNVKPAFPPPVMLSVPVQEEDSRVVTEVTDVTTREIGRNGNTVIIHGLPQQHLFPFNHVHKVHNKEDGRVDHDAYVKKLEDKLDAEERNLFTLEGDIYSFEEAFGETHETAQYLNMVARHEATKKRVDDLRNEINYYHTLGKGVMV